MSAEQNPLFTSELIARMTREHEEAMARAALMAPDPSVKEWLVQVPEYDHDGIKVARYVITEEEANLSKIRAAFNPQRGDRSADAGTYTNFFVDGQIWMSDTPAEIRDLREVDRQMAMSGSMLIAGLGLGVVLNRAITAHDISGIDVVEIDPRIVEAVGPYFRDLAEKHDVDLAIHVADIHRWRAPRGAGWDVGWFDIWPTISDIDLPEVTRLRNRFRSRLGWFGAWAQDERLAMKRRVKSGKWAY
jgi:hypothetical protein